MATIRTHTHVHHSEVEDSSRFLILSYLRPGFTWTILATVLLGASGCLVGLVAGPDGWWATSTYGIGLISAAVATFALLRAAELRKVSIDLFVTYAQSAERRYLSLGGSGDVTRLADELTIARNQQRALVALGADREAEMIAEFVRAALNITPSPRAPR